ncbi:hypothetical protein GCM10009858_44700 [Terrabacter carboxydivorans]|uniref:Uncharacterized protein n=1 Tax=Terrabacter carboxydivorans TaxID=619730 RepID=A0ABP5ZQG6_9MICO
MTSTRNGHGRGKPEQNDCADHTGQRRKQCALASRRKVSVGFHAQTTEDLGHEGDDWFEGLGQSQPTSSRLVSRRAGVFLRAGTRPNLRRRALSGRGFFGEVSDSVRELQIKRS